MFLLLLRVVQDLSVEERLAVPRIVELVGARTINRKILQRLGKAILDESLPVVQHAVAFL